MKESQIPNENEKLDSLGINDTLSHQELGLISDEPLTSGKQYESWLNFNEYSATLSQIIETCPAKFSIGIFGGWGTGKTRLMRMILSRLKNKENIIPVWFNAWKHERDKYLAVIPLLKLIEVELNNRQNRKLKTLRKGVQKTFRAFADSISITAGLGDYGSVGIDLNKFLKSLKGSTEIDGERVYYYSHPTEHLQESLRSLDRNLLYRIVVFIDDLDRCMPDRAVEVLESIKSFFDIDGFVFIIGMNYATIDDLMIAKYGKDSTITGREYLEKIVQLPFYIPRWNDPELEKVVRSIISEEKGVSILLNEFKDCEKLVVSAIRKNPRDAKRFINSIILTRTVFGKIKGLKIDRLIAVQALRYREEWNKLLEIIRTDDNKRIRFFDEYLKLKELNDIDNFKKVINKIYPNFFDTYDSVLLEDNPLRQFLDSGAAEKLRDIEEIEYYMSALSSTDKPGASVEDITIRLSSDKNGIKVGEELEVHALVLNNDGVPLNGVPVSFDVNDTNIAELQLSARTILTDEEGMASTNVKGKRVGKTNLKALAIKVIYDIKVDIKKKILKEDSLELEITS